MKLRYGIVSTATITKRFIKAVKAYGDEVYAIASRSLNKAEEMANAFDIPHVYDNYEKMYADKNVDIVYIATNNATHVEQIKLALTYGKHVIVEKPMALNKQDAMDVFSLAKKQKRFLMEAQKSVFLPVTLDIKKMIESQTLGRLHQVEMSSSFDSPTAAWMHDPSQGGVIYGSANYTFHYLDFLLKPKQTKIQAMGILEESGTCERVSITMCMDDVLINSRISMNGLTQNHAIFYFEKGYVRVNEYWKAQHYFIYEGEVKHDINHPVDFEMIYEVEHIHDCIESKQLTSPIMNERRSIQCCDWVETIINQVNQ